MIMTSCSFEPICAHRASKEVQDDLPIYHSVQPARKRYSSNQAAPAKEVMIFIFHFHNKFCFTFICFEFGEGFYKTNCGYLVGCCCHGNNDIKLE